MDDAKAMEAAHHLYQAALAIRKASPSFDAGGKACTCCGLHVANNLEERNLSNTLGGMIRKLEEMAVTLGQLHDRRREFRRVTPGAADPTKPATIRIGDRRRGYPGGPDA